MPNQPAFILGGGLVTALGRGRAAHVGALAAAVAAPRPSPAVFMGQALPFHFASSPGEGAVSFRGMIEAAVEDALAEAALPAAAVARMGVFVGSTCLDLPLHEAAYDRAAAGGAVPAVKEPGYGHLARDIAARFGVRGPQYTFSTACSSSANAALYARAMLADGRIDHALVVGAEGYNRLSLLGFAGLMLLSRSRYRPFDRDRDGLVLGEGVGALVLGRQRGSSAFSVIGGASACDPSSPTGSSPQRIAQVIREAMADARLGPADIVAIKAHGTGTPTNDLSEGQALNTVFGGTLPPLTSLKPCVGHTLGASGAIEMIALRDCWQEGFLPPTAGFEHADAALALEPQTRPLPLGDGAVLCTSSGFGGNNTSLVLARRSAA